MTSTDRPTLKSVTERLDAVEGRLSAVRESDPEARALSRCAQALDALPKVSSVTTYTYRDQHTVDFGAVDRILNYLRQRYNLPDPAAEAARLRTEVERLRERCFDLDRRLLAVRGAADEAVSA